MAAKKDEAWVRKIKDLTECSICTEEFVDPRALPCLHTFCLRCLRALVRKTDSDEAYLCPLCRCEFDIPGRGVIDFPKNFYVDSLIEVEKESDSLQKVPYSSTCCDVCVGITSRTPARSCASWYCSDCDQNLCDVCFQCHKRITSTNKHNLVPSSIASRGSSTAVKTVERKFCERHPERVVELWCRDCHVPSCTMCLLSDHNGHKFGALRDSALRSSQPAAAQLGARPRVLAAATPAPQTWRDLVQASRRSAATAVTATATVDSSRVVTTAAAAQSAVRPAAAVQAAVTSAAQAAGRSAVTSGAQAGARPSPAQNAVRPAATQTAVRPGAQAAPAAQAPELQAFLRLLAHRLTEVSEATTTSVVTSSAVTSTTAASSTVNSSTPTTSALVGCPTVVTSSANSSARAISSSVTLTFASTVSTSTVSPVASAGTPIVTATTQSLVDSRSSSSLGASASASAAELASPFTFTGHCYRCGWQGHRAFECQEDADDASASPSEVRSGIASARSLSRESSSDDESTRHVNVFSSVVRALTSLTSLARDQRDSLSSRNVEILGDSDDSSSDESFHPLPSPPPPPRTMHCNGCGAEGHTSRFCRNKQQCHNCGCYGHKRETCSRESRVTKCYDCNELGHVAQDCPTTAYRRVTS